MNHKTKQIISTVAFLIVTFLTFYLVDISGVNKKSDLEKERDSIKRVYNKWKVQEELRNEIWYMELKMNRRKRDSLFEDNISKIKDKIQEYKNNKR